jgi:hypothetical protein
MSKNEQIKHTEATMKLSFIRLNILNFSELDNQITKFRNLRDSYREANIAYYGEYLAALLNDCD